MPGPLPRAFAKLLTYKELRWQLGSTEGFQDRSHRIGWRSLQHCEM